MGEPAEQEREVALPDPTDGDTDNLLGNVSAPMLAASAEIEGCAPDASGREMSSAGSESFGLSREVSDIPLDQPDGAQQEKKKKKKKRVGGIAFAEVMVTEQVIKESEEELKNRREHWQTIQKRAEDPNTVFSNDSSKANSGVSSPTRGVKEESNGGSSSKPESASVLDAGQLEQQLLELQKVENAASLPAEERGFDAEESSLPAQDITSDTPPPSAELEPDADTSAEAAGIRGGHMAGLDGNAVPLEGDEGPQDQQPVLPSETAVGLAQPTHESEHLKRHVERVDGGPAHVEAEQDATVALDEPAQTSMPTVHQQPGDPVQEDDAADAAAVPVDTTTAVEAEPVRPEDEPPANGCPSISFPNLNSYVSDKEREELFSTMARELLEYVECWPTARKAPEKPGSPSPEAKSTRKGDGKGGRKKGGKDGSEERPRDEQTAKDLAYTLKRWLLKVWQEGKVLRNTFHLGLEMEKDADQLVRGQDPLIESRLETVWNGTNFEVRSTPLANTSEADFLELALRFQNRHRIGDRFFPSEEYDPRTGIPAYRPLPSTTPLPPSPEAKPGDDRRLALEEEVYWQAEEAGAAWEDDVEVGLAADHAAQAHPLDLSAHPAAPITGRPRSSSDPGGGLSFSDLSPTSLHDLVAASHSTWLSPPRPAPLSRSLLASTDGSLARTSPSLRQAPSSVRPLSLRRMSRALSLHHSAGIDDARAWQPQKRRGAGAASAARSGEGERRVRKWVGAEERERRVEEEAAFRAFIKSSTGRSRVSQRQLRDLRGAYAQELERRQRVQALVAFEEVLGEVNTDWASVDWPERFGVSHARMQELVAELEAAQGGEGGGQAQRSAESRGRGGGRGGEGGGSSRGGGAAGSSGGSRSALGGRPGASQPAAMSVEELWLAYGRPKQPTSEALALQKRSTGHALQQHLQRSYEERNRGEEMAEELLRRQVAWDEEGAGGARRGEEGFAEFLDSRMQAALATDKSLSRSLTLYSTSIIQGVPQPAPYGKVRMAEGASGAPTRLPGLKVPGKGVARRTQSLSATEKQHAARARGGSLESAGALGPRSGAHSALGHTDSCRSPYAQKMVPLGMHKKASRMTARDKHQAVWHPNYSRIGSQDAVGHLLADIRI